jgi:hypothetical protein
MATEARSLGGARAEQMGRGEGETATRPERIQSPRAFMRRARGFDAGTAPASGLKAWAGESCLTDVPRRQPARGEDLPNAIYIVTVMGAFRAKSSLVSGGI